jgi:hypothetical protein
MMADAMVKVTGFRLRKAFDAAEAFSDERRIRIKSLQANGFISIDDHSVSKKL